MGSEEFIKKAKSVVFAYAEARLDVTDKVNFTIDDVYVVWLSKALQNSKALLSTSLPDGMYYEVTLNGDKREMYLDAYKKERNELIYV